MTFEAHSDHGSVLRPDQFAIAASPDNTLTFFIPKYSEGMDFPRAYLLIGAILARINDEAWIDEMIGDLADRM
jgi:hypothetical protein